MRRILSALALTAAIAMVMVPTAANAAEVRAPYARAAAEVSSTGVLVHEKNIVRAWKVGGTTTGQYCVTVDPSVDVTKAIVTISESDYKISLRSVTPSGACGQAANTVSVYLLDSAGNWSNGSFTLVVH